MKTAIIDLIWAWAYADAWDSQSADEVTTKPVSKRDLYGTKKAPIRVIEPGEGEIIVHLSFTLTDKHDLSVLLALAQHRCMSIRGLYSDRERGTMRLHIHN